MGKQANAKSGLFAKWQPGGALVVADQGFLTGNRYYVHSVTGTDAAGWGSSPDKPVATLDYAVSLCTACKGDVVYALPGHSETVIAVDGCVMDVEGVSVIGLGFGSLQPLITLGTAAAATVSITAASVLFKNFHILADYTGGLTVGITIGALADGCTVEDVVMRDGAATKEFLKGISIADACTDVTIRRLRYYGSTVGHTSSVIFTAGAADRLLIEDCFIDAFATAAIVKLDTGAIVDAVIRRNVTIQRDTAAGLGIDCGDLGTGMMADNRTMNLRNGVEGHTGNLMAYHENYCTNAVNVQGFLLPAADTY